MQMRATDQECHGRGLNPVPPAHEARAPHMWPLRESQGMINTYLSVCTTLHYFWKRKSLVRIALFDWLHGNNTQKTKTLRTHQLRTSKRINNNFFIVDIL